MAHPYNTVQEGVDAAPVDYTVLVDDSGVAYAEEGDYYMAGLNLSLGF